MSAPIQLIVTSSNPVKLNAAKFGSLESYWGRKIRVTSFPVEPVIEWKSSFAIGQPFGVRQTAFGAIDRMRTCWEHAREMKEDFPCSTYAVAFENGLVQPEEVGQEKGAWFDVCFVALRSLDLSLPQVIVRGKFVRTDFFPPEKASQEDFDGAVKVYEEKIMPKVRRKEDLYLEWTNSLPGSLKTRESFLQDCQKKAWQELSHLKKAKEIVQICREFGMAASAGPRYKGMLWTRDLAYMAPVYLQSGAPEEFLMALRNLRDEQYSESEIYNNGYGFFDRLGKLPIVCIPKEHRCMFLQNRILGTQTERGWQKQLRDFIQNKGLLVPFPEAPSTFYSTEQEWRDYYYTLVSFREQFIEENPPKPSYALRAFMEGWLLDLTPGTQDSEIHYIRSIISFLRQGPMDKMVVLEQEGFAASMAKALFYLYMNVLDPVDGLPYGADSRDTFADVLYDAKTLTNAVFWFQALQGLLEYAEDLEQTVFRSTLEGAINNYAREKVLPEALHSLKECDLTTFFTQQLEHLKTSIEDKLLFEEGRFMPRDFIPGARAKVALDQPITPSPIIPIIKKDNPDFMTGNKPDPQSLAQAVLTGLIPKKYYEEVFQIFLAADSPIGVQVFVPISGKDEEESHLLQRVKGQVVWPHVTWNVIRALIEMDDPRYLNMAEEQRDKLMRLGGCSEWCAIDPDMRMPVNGGEPLQGWSATGMIMANEAFFRYYSLNR